MAIVAKSSGADFERELPPAGLHRAVCVDVIYLGYESYSWGGKEITNEKIRLVWELDPETAGMHSHFENPHRITNKYTLSIHDKANLTKDLVSWRGKKFTDEEKKGFDVEQLVGVACLINVVHSDDGDWANLGAIMPPQKDRLEPSGAYIRVADRVEEDEPAKSQSDDWPDEKLPF